MDKKTEKKIRQLVAEVVADHYAMLLEMAYDRGTYIDRMVQHLSGALSEHCKSIVAARCGLISTADGWDNEVGSLLHAFRGTYMHKITGFKDRKKALQTAIDRVKNDISIVSAAVSKVQNKLSLNKMTVPQLHKKLVVSAKDLDQFWEQVQKELPSNF